MRKIGYLRVSTEEQRPDRQIEGLSTLCDELYIEVVSGAAKDRPVYRKVTRRLRRGDMLVVWDLDRAYRSAADALNELERLRRRRVEFQIVNLALDTTTPAGIFVFTLLAALSEFERRTLSQRTREGLAAARRRGSIIGRPRKLSDAQIRRARSCLSRKTATLRGLAAEFKVAPWTLSRNLKQR